MEHRKRRELPEARRALPEARRVTRELPQPEHLLLVLSVCYIYILLPGQYYC